MSLAPVWVGKSAGFDLNRIQPADDDVEKLCDRVAAEFLVPESSFNSEWAHQQNFLKLSTFFKVSPIVVARRALDLQKISKNSFNEFYDEYIAGYKRKKDAHSSGGEFYSTSKKRISVTFARHIDNAVNSNQLSYREAYELTGLYGNTYARFLQKSLQ